MGHRGYRFLVTSEAIWQWFSRVTKWKSLSKRLTSDKKSVFRVAHSVFYFLNTIVCPEDPAHKSSRTAHFANFAKDGLFDRNVSTVQCVMPSERQLVSYSSIIVTRANWSKRRPSLVNKTVDIDFPPPGIHGLARKRSQQWFKYL